MAKKSPFFGIPAKISGKFTTAAEATAFKANPTPSGSDSFGNITTPVFDAAGNRTGTKFSASPENTAKAQLKALADVPLNVLKQAVAGFEGTVSQSVLDRLADRASSSKTSSSIVSGLGEVDETAGLGRKISSVEELNKLTEQGLTEAGIVRIDPNTGQVVQSGGDIYLKGGGGADTTVGPGDITPDVDTTGAGVTGEAQDPFLKAMQELLEFQKGRPSVIDQYKQLREELGLGAKEERLSGIQAEVMKTENLLDDLEDSINERISGKGVSEALRQRLLATGRKPIIEGLETLTRSEEQARLGVSSARQQLSDLMTLHQQQEGRETEQQKIALDIAKFQSDQAKDAGQSKKDIIEGYIKKYADAGIKLTDSLATAQEKLKSSKIYQNDIRLLNKGGGGTGTGLSYKFSTGIKTTLLGGGFSPTDISLIEKDIQEFGLDAVIEGITDPAQLKSINKAFGRKAPEADKPKTLSAKLKAMGWPDKAIRRFKQDEATSQSSLDPNRWRDAHPELFEEAGE